MDSSSSSIESERNGRWLELYVCIMHKWRLFIFALYAKLLAGQVRSGQVRFQIQWAQMLIQYVRMFVCMYLVRGLFHSSYFWPYLVLN